MDKAQMGKSLLFALFGIGIIIAFILLILQERSLEWKKFQKEFQKLEAKMIREEIKDAVNDKERQRLKLALHDLAKSDVEIKQVFLKDLGVIDRCTSCHLGMTDPRWNDAPQPFTAHTEPILSTHPVYRFGCTVCHEGQGPATTTKSGHGYDPNWKDPLLPLNYIEASCNQCHSDLSFREAPRLARGKYLIERLGCLGCHDVKNFQVAERIGPVLDLIDSKADPGWITRFLKEPRDYSEETRMPNFEFKEDEIEQIRKFLSTLIEKEEDRDRQKDLPEGPLKSSFKELQNGKKQVKDLACTTCHSVKGVVEEGFFKSDKIAPELSKVGSKLKSGWLQQYLKAPSAYQPKSRMPTYKLREKDIRELTAFLRTLKWTDGDLPKAEPVAHESQPRISNGADSEEAESGKRLIIRSNCIGCHEIKGIHKGERGPAWDGIGSRPIRKFDFGKNPDKVQPSKSAWIKAKILKPRSFRDSLKMPLLHLPEEDATSITTALLGLTDRKIPESYAVEDPDLGIPPVQVPKKGPLGGLWEELKCMQCHSVGGEGGNIGPELAFEGSRVEHDWLVKYLKKPVPIRPFFAARMPDFKLSHQEAKLLGDYIEMALTDNNVPVGTIEQGKISRKSLRRGKKLFSRKYGCIGCHRVRGKGGKIGPEVTGLGRRLKGDWAYTYLKNPQSAIPDAMMPNFALKDEEARALTEYLVRLNGDATKSAEMPRPAKGRGIEGK